MYSGQLIIAQIAVKPGSNVKGYGLDTFEVLKLQIRAHTRVILTKNVHFCLKNGLNVWACKRWTVNAMENLFRYSESP